MKLDAIINENYKSLNENDLHVLQYVKNNLALCVEMGIQELSVRCNVSTASILRMAKKLKFSGYSEFKYFLRRENDSRALPIRRSAMEELNHDLAQTLKVFQQNGTREELYEKMERADRLYAFGTGYGQRLMLNEFARCLLNVNKNLIILPATTEFNLARKAFRETDLLFIVSLSGNMESYKETIHNLDVREIPMVSITNLVGNDLATTTRYNFYFQNSNIDGDRGLNRTSFLTLHLILHLIYEGYVDYLNKKQ